MSKSSAITSLPTNKPMMGVESINTTRLLTLKSWKADIINHAVDRTWVLEKVNRRSYLQQRISLQQLKMWNAFRTVPTAMTIVNANDPNDSVTLYPGNWNHTAVANYITSVWKSRGKTQTLNWDPYQLRFVFCPPMDISGTSTINKLLGFPDTGQTIFQAQLSQFPPMDLFGIPYINVHTNFTMNNIPISEYLCSVPTSGNFGDYLFYTNFDNSMSTLVLDPDITNVRVVLTDHQGNLLDYDEELDWEIVLALQATIPEGFAPMEV